jgi:methylmalonyl-CoA/ethylmalonyl-CoA epimerase
VSTDRPRPFEIRGVNHIGLAPKDPERARWFFETALGLGHLGDELVADQKVDTRMFSSGSGAYPTRLEVLVPSPAGEGAIGKFLEKKGSGVHHVALAVDDVARAVEHLISLGVKMIDETPRRGAHDTRIAFVHPEATGGLLVELVQERS